MARVVWRSLITFGYSGEVQVPHRKSLEGVILFDRGPVMVVMLRFKLGCWLLKQIPLCRPGFSMLGGIH